MRRWFSLHLFFNVFATYNIQHEMPRALAIKTRCGHRHSYVLSKHQSLLFSLLPLHVKWADQQPRSISGLLAGTHKDSIFASEILISVLPKWICVY